MIDKDLKPNSDERRQIAAVLKLPPNKPLAAEHKALLWRFRYSLTQDKRALTKFLKCVDWGDVSEASQVGLLADGCWCCCCDRKAGAGIR
jgi:phosphatidylinositol 3-kinase